MKIDCTACGQTFEGETELAATLALVAHVTAVPDENHLSKLSPSLDELDRVMAFAATVVKDDSAIRDAIYDKCAKFDMRLKTVHLYALSHLARAVQMARDMVIECGDGISITETNAGKALWGNLREALIVAERRFR
jgi:hypothetical protein